MLYDELKEQLKTIAPEIDTIKAFWQSSHLEEQYQQLTERKNQETFWQDPQQAEILKDLSRVKNSRDQYQTIIKTYQELSELIELFSVDEKELEKLKIDIARFKKAVGQCKIDFLLSNPQDSSACFLNVNAGAGGTESQDWASMLLRMYIRFCERHGFQSTVLDLLPGEEAGIKSGVLYIKGKNAYGLLKGEQGIHRLVRISPFDSNKRRHTSFAAVAAIPETPDIEVAIDPKDLRIDTYRSGGAGGQHVNKTESAVRITHLPTNLVVQCQNERSQAQNKETALKMLKAKLAQKYENDRLEKLAGIEKKKIEWGSQIRSYVLHPYKMVKDHRTDIESAQPDLVLDGELDDFIQAYLIWNSKPH